MCGSDGVSVTYEVSEEFLIEAPVGMGGTEGMLREPAQPILDEECRSFLRRNGCPFHPLTRGDGQSDLKDISKYTLNIDGNRMEYF